MTAVTFVTWIRIHCVTFTSRYLASALCAPAFEYEYLHFALVLSSLAYISCNKLQPTLHCVLCRDNPGLAQSARTLYNDVERSRADGQESFPIEF